MTSTASAEWTTALEAAGAAPNPDWSPFTGQRWQCTGARSCGCTGRSAEAVEEFDSAISPRYRPHRPPGPQPASRECREGRRAADLRGGLKTRPRPAYEGAAFEHGHEPQPGLALLWLAHGFHRRGRGGLRRLVAEADGPAGECRLLPAAVDVLLAVGSVDDAAPSPPNWSSSRRRPVGRAAGAVGVHLGRRRVAAGDPAGALPYLRKARRSGRGWSGRTSRPRPRPHRPCPLRARRRAVGAPGADRRARELRDLGGPGGRRSRRAPSPTGSPAASPPAR